MRDEPDDLAFVGCQAWIGGWRQTHGPDAPPPHDWRLIAAVGRDAVQLCRDGVTHAELSRLMWAAGRDGTPLGVHPKSFVEAPR